METFLVIFTIVIVVYFLIRYVLFVKRFSAAMNVILAKYTFSCLSESERLRVERRAEEILHRLLKGRFNGYWGEVDRFGWFALAMAELGIQPSVNGERWSYVRNPFFAVSFGDRVFSRICEYMKRKHGIEISINREHRIFDKLKSDK